MTLKNVKTATILHLVATCKFSEHGIVVGCVIAGNVANLLMNFAYKS
jgi:hypothetical protein